MKLLSTTAFRSFQNFSSGEITGSVSLILVSTLCALILADYCAREFRGNKKKTMLTFAGIALFMSMALIGFLGFTAAAIRGAILCLILVYSSYSDIKTRECGDAPHILIAVAAFIGIGMGELPDMLLSAFFVFIIQMFAMLVMRADVNGADLKLSVACAFLLGTARSLPGMLLGMLLGIIVTLFQSRNRKAAFPLLPYLSAGFMAAYFL